MSHHLDRRARTLIESAPDGAPDELLSTAELARWLGVTSQWAELGRSKGYGPPFCRIGPKRIRYSRAAVLAWLETRTHTCVSEYR